MIASYLKSPRAASLVVAVASLTMTLASPAAADDGALFPGRVLAAHNDARGAAGVPPLQWDNQLGAEAAHYAVQLAISNLFAHSDPQARRSAGENLWTGTRGAYSVNEMVGGWVSEKRVFVPGLFPTVSRTGNWRDVAHYTQIVWPATQRVGCALATNAHSDYLVCRYWPAGNVNGIAVTPVPARLKRLR